jgi:hypothetical protein
MTDYLIATRAVDHPLDQHCSDASRDLLLRDRSRTEAPGRRAIRVRLEITRRASRVERHSYLNGTVPDAWIQREQSWSTQ